MPDHSNTEQFRIKYNKKVKSIHPQRCILNAGKCILNTEETRRNELISKQPFSFIMRPYTRDCEDMERACKEIINIDYIIARNAFSEERDSSPTRNEIATIVAKDVAFIGHGYCQICSLCLYSYFGVAELGHLNPNVMMEIGLMAAFGKPVIFTLDARIVSIDQVPFDINGILLIPYQNYNELESGLKSKVAAVMNELKNQNLL